MIKNEHIVGTVSVISATRAQMAKKGYKRNLASMVMLSKFFSESDVSCAKMVSGTKIRDFLLPVYLRLSFRFLYDVNDKPNTQKKYIRAHNFLQYYLNRKMCVKK